MTEDNVGPVEQLVSLATGVGLAIAALSRSTAIGRAAGGWLRRPGQAARRGADPDGHQRREYAGCRTDHERRSPPLTRA